MATITLTDLAKKARVSLATASRVLSGGPIRCSERTRQRILRTARQLNYVPNFSARTLRTGKSYNIAVIAYDITDAFAVECVRTMEAYLEETPYRATWISCANKTRSRDGRQMLQELALSIDGMIVIAAENYLSDTDLLRFWAAEKKPIVTVIRRLRGDLIPSVRMNNDIGMRRLLDHLIELGHRRIALTYNRYMHPSASQRYRTYRKYVAEHDLPDEKALQLPVDITMEDGYRAGELMLKTKKLPTAVVAFNDLGAFGIIQAFGEEGVRVPQEVSVAGFDDIRMARFYNPSLTSVAADYEKMAKLALDTLLAMIDRPDESAGLAADIIIQPKLVLRNSTGRARV
ncbi:MAG: LacI family DNA-binding transcriptional regulator [Planctomycetes bacterium]|nr:LacI family DNA-binding transcriptional regulator [Planctomycetota bacterium]